MENLFGLVVFLIVVGISAYSNMKKTQEEEQKRQQNPKKVRPDDLPEATRRMLYGDRSEEVQTAQPRQAERPTAPPFVQTMTPRPAAPRTTPPPIREEVPFPREYQAPPLRPTMSPVAPVPIPQPEAESQKSMQEAWQKAQAAQQERVRQLRSRQELQQQEAQRRILAETLRGRVQTQHVQQVQRQPQRPNHQQSASQPHIPLAKVPRMFHNMKNVRTAIIMKEVLGPPKGLQGF